MNTRLTILLLAYCGLIFQSAFGVESDTVWTRTYGGSIGEGAFSIDGTSDGGYIVAGEKEISYLGPHDFYLLKINPNGDTVWTGTFGDGNTNEIGRSVRQTSDGGFIIVGYAGIGETNDVYLLKTDSLGNFVWDARFGPTPDNRGHCVRQTSDGGYIIAGQAWVIRGPFGSYDAYIIKTDSLGGLQWERFIGGDMNDFALSVCEVQGGGFIAAGATQSFGVWDAYLVRFGADGDSLWARTVGGDAADEATDIMELPDQSGFVFTGISVAPSRGDADVYLARTDTDGQILWSRTYGGVNDDDGSSFIRLSDGGYVMTGMTSSFGPDGWNVYVIRTDSLGNRLWSRTLGGNGDDRGHGIASNPDGSFAVAGWTSSFGHGWLDVYVIKFVGTPTGVAEQNGPVIPSDFVLSQNYPNPFNARTAISYTLYAESRVSLNIYDVAGKLVATPIKGTNQSRGVHKYIWDGTDGKGEMVSTSVYFYELQVGNRRESKRMTLLK